MLAGDPPWRLQDRSARSLRVDEDTGLGRPRKPGLLGGLSAAGPPQSDPARPSTRLHLSGQGNWGVQVLTLMGRHWRGSLVRWEVRKAFLNVSARLTMVFTPDDVVSSRIGLHGGENGTSIPHFSKARSRRKVEPKRGGGGMGELRLQSQPVWLARQTTAYRFRARRHPRPRVDFAIMNNLRGQRRIGTGCWSVAGDVRRIQIFQALWTIWHAAARSWMLHHAPVRITARGMVILGKAAATRFRGSRLASIQALTARPRRFREHRHGATDDNPDGYRACWSGPLRSGPYA